MASSTPFSAEQKYSPESFLRALNLKVFPEASIFPSFVQVILGVGFPLAAQWNITSSPSMTVWSDGSVVKPDETKMVKRNTLSKNLNADNTAIFRLNVQYCSGIPQHYTCVTRVVFPRTVHAKHAHFTSHQKLLVYQKCTHVSVKCK